MGPVWRQERARPSGGWVLIGSRWDSKDTGIRVSQHMSGELLEDLTKVLGPEKKNTYVV